MASKKTRTDVTCGVTLCMMVIDSKWKPIILHRVSKGINRFTILLREVDGINRQMLSKQLRSLEKSGVLERKAYPEIPPRVEYSLTPLGKSLLPVVSSMQRWGDKQHMAARIEAKVKPKKAQQQIGLFD